jgi:hypothetical protein
MSFSFYVFCIFLFCRYVSAQLIETPLEKSNYKKLSSYSEIKEYLNRLESNSNLIKVFSFGKTAEGRELLACKISSSNFGEESTKIKVILFAQQHGDEPSGKEGLLLLLKEIASGKLSAIFSNVDLVIIPQLNPDGSEKNQRRNSKGKDLNRDHLLLVTEEIQALHKLFNQYLFDITIDIHEYYPYSKSWTDYGYLKNFDIQVGLLTNPNISKNILSYQKNQVLPFLQNYLQKNGFSSHEYVVGGPPGFDRIRYSTVDVNDGRQSFGILNTLSFLIEGRNGKDSIENIKNRSCGQLNAALGLLKFASQNKDAIKLLISNERNKLLNEVKEGVVVRMEHVKGTSNLELKLLSIFSEKDTLISVEEYYPKIHSISIVDKPLGYLIERMDTVLIAWMKNHDIYFSSNLDISNPKLFEYHIIKIDTQENEGLKNLSLQVELKYCMEDVSLDSFFFVSTQQLKSNLIVTAFEPKSMLGLFQNENYAYLYNNQRKYKIIRIQNN